MPNLFRKTIALAAKQGKLSTAQLIMALQKYIDKGKRNFVLNFIEQAYPLFTSLSRNKAPLTQNIKNSLSALKALYDDNCKAFFNSDPNYAGRKPNAKYQAYFSDLTSTINSSAPKQELLLLSLLIANYYGQLIDRAAWQYHSMDIAISEPIFDLFQHAEFEFAGIALHYSHSIQTLCTGEMSEAYFQEKVFSLLKQFVPQYKNYYIDFIILNLINAHTQGQGYINANPGTLAYYNRLFNLTAFQDKGLKLFTESLPAERVHRLREDINPQNISPDFAGLNVFNLKNLLSDSELIGTAKAEYLLNQICQLAQLPEIQGKDIVFDYTSNKETLFYFQMDLAEHLDANYASDPKRQTFLGFKYTLDKTNGYVRIILHK
ncbi:hypothetical protein NO1_1553 [Candidatus Termititenax aidoneus]|uniref:Uncharacterized protein n=1 Tax=Termititenax aidoneus TaxID=2218524 RepID=A0A388TC21_TERA1|nr:hypothetical protein NO1_1553 [Candidatus Termititenax aidoneus]